VRHQDDNRSDPLTMQTPFQVEVECWNLVAGAHLHVTLHLYTAEGIIAFTTGCLNNRSLPFGLFRSIVYFPGNLMNSGLHRFVILVVKDTSSVIYCHESRVAIEILDLMKREGTCYGREPGVVQPILKWSIEHVSEGP